MQQLPAGRIARRVGALVVAAARRLEPEGLIVGTAGNISARCGDGLLITPTRTSYDRLRPRDLVAVTLEGTVAPRARRRPSRELELHLAVLRARPDAGAVVHTHSPHAVAWSFLDRPLEPRLEDNDYHAIGPIRTAPHHPAGSIALALAATAVLGESNAVLLGRHGVLTLAPTPDQAVTLARVVEYQAQVAWLLRRGDRGGTDAHGRVVRGAHRSRHNA